MQRISSRMSRAIEYMYASIGNIHLLTNPDAGVVNYSLHTVFPFFFRVSLQENKIELPIFAKAPVQTKLIGMLRRSTSNPMRRSDVIIPFYTIEHNESPYRTADTLIRNMTEFISSRNGMYLTAHTNKGETYYGCDGVIFNKDMVPLILNVIECEIIDNTLVYKKVISYIHPSVFYSGGIVEKCIANKIIPFVMQNGVKVFLGNPEVIDGISYTSIGAERRIIPELLVADIADRFFCRPILPSVTYSDDDINDMLNRNIDDVFNVIGL